MNPQEQNQNPAPQEKSFGATIGIIIIVVILVIGALYYWGGKMANQNPTQPQTTNVTATTSSATSTTGY